MMRFRHFVPVAVVLAVLLATTSVWGAGATYEGFPVVRVVVNGRLLNTDVPAISVNGRTLLPVRAVADAVGAEVSWSEETQTVSLSVPDVPKLAAERDTALAANAQLRQDLLTAQQEITRLKDRIGLPNTKGVPDGKVVVAEHLVAGPYVLVRVHNSSNVPVDRIRVSMTATLNGTLQAVGDGETGLWQVLLPDSDVWVQVSASSPVPSDAQIEFLLDSHPSQHISPLLTITSQKVVVDSFSGRRLIGTIRNDDVSLVSLIFMYVVLRDAGGTVVRVTATTPAIRNLQPGQSSSFDLGLPASAVNAEVTADGFLQ